jgi:hypothetical protein
MGETMVRAPSPWRVRMSRCSRLYWPKRQGPVEPGIRKIEFAGSKPGWRERRTMSPVVRKQGRHSRPLQRSRPMVIDSSSEGGRTSAFIPLLRMMAASGYAWSDMQGM